MTSKDGARKRRASKSGRAPSPSRKGGGAAEGSLGYGALLSDLKQRISSARLQASLAVNRELILLYWNVGRDILVRQKQEGWGTKVIDRLAVDLHAAFPEMAGLSARNLKYMRAFAEAYPDLQFVQQVVALLPWGHNLLPRSFPM